MCHVSAITYFLTLHLMCISTKWRLIGSFPKLWYVSFSTFVFTISFALFHLPDSTRYITFSCHLDEIHFQASSKVVHAMNPIYTKFILEKRLMCFIMIQTPWGIILIFRLKFLAWLKSTEKCSNHISKIHVAFLIVKYSHLCYTSKSFC